MTTPDSTIILNIIMSINPHGSAKIIVGTGHPACPLSSNADSTMLKILNKVKGAVPAILFSQGNGQANYLKTQKQTQFLVTKRRQPKYSEITSKNHNKLISI